MLNCLAIFSSRWSVEAYTHLKPQYESQEHYFDSCPIFQRMMDIHQPHLFHDPVQWIFFRIFLDFFGEFCISADFGTLLVMWWFLHFILEVHVVFFRIKLKVPMHGKALHLLFEVNLEIQKTVINPLCSRKLVGFGQNADVGSGFRGAPLPHCVVSGADDPQSLVVTTWVKANIQQWASKDVQCEDFYILGRLWCQTTNKVLVALTQLYPTHIKIAWGRFVLQSKPNGKH